MMKNYILYNSSTGAIVLSQTGEIADIPAGFATMCTDNVFVDPVKQQVDLATGTVQDCPIDPAEIWTQRRDRVRRHRNWLLSDSDWTQLPDVALSTQQRAAWQTYRQQLRDIMQTVPAEPAANYRPVWPDKPE